jgi:hypothetical protein
MGFWEAMLEFETPTPAGKTPRLGSRSGMQAWRSKLSTARDYMITAAVQPGVSLRAWNKLLAVCSDCLDPSGGRAAVFHGMPGHGDFRSGFEIAGMDPGPR